ncbi:hypothetical protein BGZ63DRAFT_357995 [Mariannaea sp. PMI_226]|nr:hypothetical protein BGZ63DRAFT_357995 [Mariannaea sp. PMI_226]
MLPDARYEENPAQAPRAAEAANLPVRSQPARALDPQDGSLTSQFFGPSGETDPYLLRHMRFSEEGSCNFGQFQYRSLYQGTTRTELSPSDNNNAFPVHFMISAPRNPFSKDGSEEPEEHTQREDLDRLVDPELGARLVGLFLRYVFPSLPVLSRSTLNVRTETLIPKAKALDNLPSYLLAAVYASADMFRRYDPTLNVSRTDAEIHTTALWRMAHRGIMRQMHMPRLAVIQALLIYLQRPMEDTITATTDSPGQWPLLGSVVQLASQIGLHLDCQLWPIPEWEKRLRRRLWWVVYSEAIWRSLLLGLPQPIQAGQWEVTPLGEKDFLIDHLQCPTEETATQTPALQKPCGFCHAGHDFRFLADLTLISYDVYQSFYTLSATKGLSNDFEGSLNLGRIYLDRLNKWGAQLPKQMALDAVSNTETRDYFHSGSASHLKLAFFTLKAMVYRAIIRPLANAGPPESMAPTSTHLDENTNQCSPTANSSITATLGLESSAIIQDALNLSRQASQWAQRLGSYDRNSFSPCFATISNLIMLLLLLAPTAASAKEVLAVLARWVIILREQSIVFNNMQLGLLRLDAIFRLGLAKAFRFSTHVADSVHRELPTPSYQR